jgi:hypothetical protein
MAFDLPLPLVLRKAGWRVKIRDREIREPPHVTIIRRTYSWRIDLREEHFMDDRPDPADVPDDLLQVIRKNWRLLCRRWNEMYPTNPVADDEV